MALAAGTRLGPYEILGRPASRQRCPDSNIRPAQQQIRIVLNWFEELKTKVPTK